VLIHLTPLYIDRLAPKFQENEEGEYIFPGWALARCVFSHPHGPIFTLMLEVSSPRIQLKSNRCQSFHPGIDSHGHEKAMEGKMASLIECPTCKKQVSTQAPTCPNCGHPIATPIKKASEIKASLQKKRGSGGAGCLVQVAGIIGAVILYFLFGFYIGGFLGLVVLVSTFKAGSDMSYDWICSHCGNKSPSKTAKRCASCSAVFSG
jgi:ribosomal protein L37E